MVDRDQLVADWDEVQTRPPGVWRQQGEFRIALLSLGAELETALYPAAVIGWLAEATGYARVLRWISTLDERIEILMTQNDEVAALVAQLGGDVASLRSSLAGVSGDVSYLKAKIDALPVGGVLTEHVLADLRDTVGSVAEVTDAYAALDAETDSSDPQPSPPEPADPDA